MSQKLTIGYVPYSKDLSHPGDRRRVGIINDSLTFNLEVGSPLNCELLVLSGASNLNYWIKRTNKPVILDIVDGYLGERPSLLQDALRNLVRASNKSSNFSALTYSRALKRACTDASAVIVASPEQAEQVLQFNKNVFVILDDHSELDFSQKLRAESVSQASEEKCIFWEGFGYTIKHFKIIAPYLDKFLLENKFKLVLLTNITFPRWGSYIGTIDTSRVIKRLFPLSYKKIEIIPWTLNKVIEKASQSNFAIIPVDTTDKFADLKPENKLMSMWHLGLPTLFSNTKAYQRVADEVGISSMCIKQDDWEIALRNLELAEIRDSMPKAINYINEYHTRKILLEKWEKVFETVLANNV
jgi:hypothetical protein